MSIPSRGGDPFVAMGLSARPSGNAQPVRRPTPFLGWLAVLLAGVLATLPLERSAHAAVPVLVIDGKGFGHGVGMAQDGAYWMARAGASTTDILGHFYPGTALGTGTGNVRVVVATPTGPDIDIVFPAGGEVRDAKDGAQSP